MTCRSLGARFFELLFFTGLLVVPMVVSAQVTVEHLRAKIAAGSTEEKRNALFEIRNLRTEAAARLAVPLLSDQVEIVRATAASSIIFLQKDEALKLLVPLLDDASPFVRREAASAIGELQIAAAAPALIEALRKEKEIENRSAAAMALGKAGDPSAIGPLTSILKNRPSESQEFLRAAASRSIGEIAQTIRFGKRQEMIPQNFLPDKYKEKREEISEKTDIASLREIAVPILRKVIENRRESADTRRNAAFALGSIGGSAALDLLRTYVNSEDPYLAEICKEALLGAHANN